MTKPSVSVADATPPDVDQIDLEKLTAPFPKEAHRQRQGGGGKMLTYVQGHTVINRLNAATGNRWNFTVDKIESTQIDASNTMLMAYVTLSIPGLGTRSHVGVQSINARGGEDLVKGAVTDALKKAATLFGVGIELYGPDYEDDDERTTRRPVPPPKPAPPERPSLAPTKANGPVAMRTKAEEQLAREDPDMAAAKDRTELNRELHGLAQKRGLNHPELRRVCIFHFPHIIDEETGERITITSMTQLRNDMLLAMIEKLDPILDEQGQSHALTDEELAQQMRDWMIEIGKAKSRTGVLDLGGQMRAAGISRATHPDLFIAVSAALEQYPEKKAVAA